MKSSLNDKQKEAVYLGFGPALILAGPGSGKTTVILERIKHLIYELNISPKHILVITFTKSAALEMKSRAAKILNLSEESPFFGTFHSYFYSVLKRSTKYRNFSIMTSKQKYQNLENIFKVNFPAYRISNNFMQEVFVCFSKYKNSMDISEDIMKLGFSVEQFETLCKTYDNFNIEQRLMDYDDIIGYTLKLLKESPYVLDCLRKEIQYILVDEFQDVNKLQYELVLLLSGHTGNLFVVGDDDQSIYHFRGAGEENLKQFENDFAPQKVVLDINYRCPKEIVTLSSKLISHNEGRFIKELHSGKNTAGSINCNHFTTKEQERNYIVESVKILEKQVGEKKIAVLCRTNSQLRILAEMLKKEKIKFYTKEKSLNFYELPYVRPIIGYMMFATGIDLSRKNLLTFLNQPIRYIKRELLAEWDLGERRLDRIKTENSNTKKALCNLHESLGKIRKLSPQIAISYILKVVGYESFALAKCRSKEELEQFKQCIEELKERAKTYDTLRQWMEFIRWEENTEITETKEKDVTDEKIFLYTFHGAKGLEFDTVFIPHLNEGSVPYGKNLTKEELEEERRMFYVALTRSANKLYISFVENGTKKDTASRFLNECGLTVSNKSSY